MSPKNKKGKKLTSTIMALAMTVTTTFQMPIISMASEIESSVAVESQMRKEQAKSLFLFNQKQLHRLMQNRPIQ